MTIVLLPVCCWLVAAAAALPVAVTAHEAAHLLVAKLLGLEVRMHAGPAAILHVLDPRPPGRAASRWAKLPHVTISAGSCARLSNPAAALQWTRHAGWLASTALACAAGAVYSMWAAAVSPAIAAVLQAVAAVTALVAACTLPTDLLSHGGAGPSSLSFFCGNLGLLIESVDDPIDAMDVLERQCSITMMRGAQSGGLVTLVSSQGAVNAVRVRVAPTKRQSLAKLLSRRFRLAAGNAGLAGGHGLFLGHTRFATSSIPLASESHPHQWTATLPAVVWRVDASAPGGICRGMEQWGVYITHNGDYDLARDMASCYRTHHEAAQFLTAVLGSPPPAKCDSVCIAGMMELHRTQGMWAAALRLALVEVAGVPFDSIAASAATNSADGKSSRTSKGSKEGRIGSSGCTTAAPDVDDIEAGTVHGSPVATAAELATLGAALDSAFGRFLTGRARRHQHQPMQKADLDSADGQDASGQDSNDIMPDQLPTPFLDDDADSSMQLFRAPQLTDDEWKEALRKPVAPGTEAQGLLRAIGGVQGAMQLIGVLAGALASELGLEGGPHPHKQRLPAWMGHASLEEVAAATLDNFIHADLFTALTRVTRAAKDSFGVAATCTLDLDRVCLAAWNQPMSVGVCPDLGAAVFGSETEVVMLNLLRGGGDPATPAQPNGWRQGHCTHRIDMDEGGGEVIQLVLSGDGGRPLPCSADDPDGWLIAPEHPRGGFLRLRVYSVRDAAEVEDLAEFQAAGRVVPLVDNPYVHFSSINLSRGHDAVAADLADIPRVLRDIAEDWAQPESFNRRTAAAFAGALRGIAEERRASAKQAGDDDASGQDIDVLLVGVEVSLWLAEQFSADLKTLLPGLRVKAISANKLIGVLGSNRGRVPATGFPFCHTSARLDDAIALVVSHSGQTFPTIHATRLLHAIMPGRVFIMSGSIDTKMALVLGQHLLPQAPFCERAFNTKAGWRSAEPATVSVVATAHTMTELLLCTGAMLSAATGSSAGGLRRLPFGLALSAEELLDLRIAKDNFVQLASPALAGVDADGVPAPSQHHAALVAAGRRWALHVLEGPWAWALAAAYIAATVISGYPLARSIMDAITTAAGASAGVVSALAHVALVMDVAIYVWSGILAATLLRLVQRRPLMARWGKRTVVVADVPHVNQIVDAYLSKLFALSYGIASVEVHGANPADHFVHKFTHRVTRGVLIAMGRPDGRLYSQTQTEGWILLGLLQAKVIASLRTQPEVLTLGHNPFKNEYIDTHVVLPTTRPKGLAELLQITDEGKGANPNALFAARTHALASTMSSGGGVSALQRHRVSSCAALFRAETENLPNGGSAHSPGPQRAASAGTTATPGVPSIQLSNLSRQPTVEDLMDTPLGGFSSREPSAHAGRRNRTPPPGGAAAGTAAAGTAAAGTAAAGTAAAGTAAELAAGAGGRRSPGALLAYGSEGHVLGEHCLSPRPDDHSQGTRGLHRRLTDLARHRDSLLAEGDELMAGAATAAMGALAGRMTQMLEEQGVIEALLESRFLSLERLISFFVMFHAMAARVAAAWPLTFDISRSQSGLRIATTASPVLASDIEQTLDELAAERGKRKASQRRAAAVARWKSAAERAVRLSKLKKL